MDFILSVIAALIGYLVTTGTQIARDKVERAKQFIEARRSDGEFRDAAEITWAEMRNAHGKKDPDSEVGALGFTDISQHIATVADVYEEMAILIKYRHVDEDLLYDYYGNPVIRFFSCYHEQIYSFKKVNLHYNSMDITTATEYIELEWLYERWLPRYQRWVTQNSTYLAKLGAV